MICKGRNMFHCLQACAATTAILAAVALSPTVRAAEQGNWVPTWAASPQAPEMTARASLSGGNRDGSFRRRQKNKTIRRGR